MPREYDNRNKTKSWREIDKQREKTSHGGKGERDKKQDAKREHSSVYKNYKKDLDSVFSGGEVPDHLRKFIPEGDKSGQLQLIGAIKRSKSHGDLEKAMKAYLAKHEDFPDDFDLLLQILDYPDEAVQLMVVKALDRLSLVMPVPHKQQFILKLDSIAMLGEDDDLIELSETLVSRFR